MSEPSERRQAKRVAIRLPVVYRGPDGAPKHGTTENVSRRGMLLVAQDQAPDGRVAVSIAESDAAEIDAIVDSEESPPEA